MLGFLEPKHPPPQNLPGLIFKEQIKMTDWKVHLLPVLFKLNRASAPGQGRRSERESTLGGNKNKKLALESTELGGHIRITDSHLLALVTC